MRIPKKAMAGTLESNDALVSVEPIDSGIEIELTSPVEKQFGTQMRAVIRQTLEALEAEAVRVTVVDRGALDCTLRARVETALTRAGKR